MLHRIRTTASWRNLLGRRLRALGRWEPRASASVRWARAVGLGLGPPLVLEQALEQAPMLTLVLEVPAPQGPSEWQLCSRRQMAPWAAHRPAK